VPQNVSNNNQKADPNNIECFKGLVKHGRETYVSALYEDRNIYHTAPHSLENADMAKALFLVNMFAPLLSFRRFLHLFVNLEAGSLVNLGNRTLQDHTEELQVECVRKVFDAVCNHAKIPKVSANQLENLYPALSPKELNEAIIKARKRSRKSTRGRNSREQMLAKLFNTFSDHSLEAEDAEQVQHSHDEDDHMERPLKMIKQAC
jgi:hypothetical protein